MTTMVLEQQTKSYWQLVSGASDQVKIALISLLSSSLMSKGTEEKASEKASHVKIRPEDLEITPFVASIGQGIKPLPADFDYEKAKEDYLMQFFSAKHEDIDYIITRNKKDFKASDIPVFKPQEFVDYLLKTGG